MSSSDLYSREEFMEHYKNPLNKGTIDNATSEIIEVNEYCGDTIRMQFLVQEDKIKDIVFTGEACSVSIASASILTDTVKGKTLEEAKSVTKDELLELIGVELTTSRVQCAMVALKALEGLIKSYESK